MQAQYDSKKQEEWDEEKERAEAPRRPLGCSRLAGIGGADGARSRSDHGGQLQAWNRTNTTDIRTK